MYKKYLAALSTVALAFALAVAVAPSNVAAQAQASKIRVVDWNKIAMSSGKGRKLLAPLEKKKTRLEKKFKSAGEKLQAEGKKISLTAPQSEKVNFQKRLQQHAMEVQQAQQQLAQESQNIQRKVITALQPVFESYARETGIGLLIDASGAVVYAAPEWDKTSALLKRVK